MEIDLLPVHKQEQFEERLVLADKQCLLDGQCKMCGCSTPALFMLNEACDGGCYREMMDREDWNNYKQSTMVQN